MKTVCHLLPGFCPVDCEYAQSSKFSESFSFPLSNTQWEGGGEPGGQKYFSLCLSYDPASQQLWLLFVIRRDCEGFGRTRLSRICGLSLFSSSSDVKGGLWVEECRCWVRKNTTSCRVGTVNCCYPVDLLTFNLLLLSMKLTGKCFCFCSSFTYSSWTSAFATPFNDTTATKSHLIPFHQGSKLLKM